MIKLILTNLHGIKDYCFSITTVFNEDHYYLRTFDDINESLSIYYFIEFGEVIVGYLVLYKFNTEVCKRIFVLESMRGIGIGSEVFKQVNIKSLSCYKDNDLAISFYLKNGFEMKESSQMHLVRFEKI